jgi:Tfp pilus assembly protein PilF
VRLDAHGLAQALAHLEHGDWQAAHEIVQQDEESPLACWAHGIVHLIEGDVSNARYWYREAGRAFPRNASIQDEIRTLKESL